MKCLQCKSENDSTREYCYSCGTKLFVHDERINRIRSYLPGGLVEKILSQKNKIEGERRQVTVMFCDMKGFTYMVDQLSEESVYRIMDDVYEILSHCVRACGGIVNEMSGDGIIALFGAPIALEDAPQKALYAALEIHNDLARYNKEVKNKMPIKMRIGIHHGPVVVGILGNDLRVEFKAVGDTVNLAARMEDLAVPGMTYVTEEVVQLAQSMFDFKPLGPMAVKGKKEKIQAYQLLSKKKGIYRPRLESERMIYSDMVGRDKEIDQLELQVMKAINGYGSIVNIIGEPGIGKSRLIAELKKREVMNRVTLIEGRAISIGENLSFHPIIDLLKKWANIREDDGEASALAKLETAVRRVNPEKTFERIPFIATLMRVKLTRNYEERIKGIEGEALEKLILKTVRELLIDATDSRTLLIVIEDLHWADLSTIDMMESLLRLAESQRIIFVNVFRPGYMDTGERLVKTIKEKLSVYYKEIVLYPLDEESSETIINNMLKGISHYGPVIVKITQRTGGNPYFIEEVVRSFIDEGAAVLKDGAFKLTDKVQEMAIPYSIEEVLTVRRDRLEGETRDLVKIASVIGRNFYYRIVLDIADSIDDIDRKLLYLTEIQLISVRKRNDEIEYQFKHTLAQEAAYDSILLYRRKLLHLKVAESIEKIFSNKLHEFYGMLAYHYSQGEDEERTEKYLIKAGEEALKSSASIEALHYYQAALKLYLKTYGDAADPEKLSILEKNIAFALFNKGQYTDAIIFFDRALKCYGERTSAHRVFVYANFVYCFANFVIGLYFPYLRFKKTPSQREREILLLYINKAKALGVIDPKRFFIEAISIGKSMAKYDLTQIENGAAWYSGISIAISWSGISHLLSRKILEFCHCRINKDDIKSLLFNKMCELAYNCVAGNYEVDSYDSNLIDQNLYIGEIYPAVLYIFHHGNRSVEEGNREKAQQMIDKLYEISGNYENDFSKTIKYELNAKMLLKYRRIKEAVIETRKGIDFTAKLGMSMYVHTFHSLMARLKILLEDLRGAEESLSRANEYKAEAAGMPYYHSPFLISQFLLDLCLLKNAYEYGNRDKIYKYRRKAKKSGKRMLRNSRKVACDLTESLRLMGVYCWLTGKQKDALIWWGKSIGKGKQLRARLELSRTYFEIGKSMFEPKSNYSEFQGIKNRQYLDNAISLYVELDLKHDIEEFNRTVSV
jgi:class 3 adenylate cyclase